jgi:hypothetical protein
MKRVRRTPIPKEFRSLHKAGEFWDTHSAADYWDQMEDVEMHVNIQSRRFAVLLDDEIYRATRQRAQARHLSPDEFVNQLLRKELMRATR